MEKDKTEYIGNGVYAKFDGFHVCIYTSDGIEMTNSMFLDEYTAEELVAFFIKCFGK